MRRSKAKAPQCPYCKGKSQLVTGEDIYPGRRDLAHKLFFACMPCDARVGCHPGTRRPLGTLANGELRRLRMMAHHAFDKLWDRSVRNSRSAAYRWITDVLEIKGEFHIGESDEARCRRVIAICLDAQRVPHPSERRLFEKEA